METNNVFRKCMVVAIICLFVGVGALHGLSEKVQEINRGLDIEDNAIILGSNLLINGFSGKTSYFNGVFKKNCNIRYGTYTIDENIDNKIIEIESGVDIEELDGKYFPLFFIKGSITNLETFGNTITFSPVVTEMHYLSHGSYNSRFTYFSGVPDYLLPRITISRLKVGVISEEYILALCWIIAPSTVVTMSPVNHNDTLNEITWEVTIIGGDPLMCYQLGIEFDPWPSNYGGEGYDQDNDNYLSIGDTFVYRVEEDGYYKTIFRESYSGLILYESPSVKY